MNTHLKSRGVAALFVTILIIFALTIATNMARASDGDNDGVKKEADEPTSPVPVDRRYRFQKRHQSELTITGGDYLGDEWQNTWDVGAKYTFNINNTFGIGASYLYTPINADDSSTFGRSLRTDETHILDAELAISNDCAFRSGKSIVECDLYMIFGSGAMRINRQWEPVGVVGGGLRIYTHWPWLVVRFDVVSYIHPTPNPTGTTYNADLLMNGGVSFLFPVRKTKENQPSSSDEGNLSVSDTTSPSSSGTSTSP